MNEILLLGSVPVIFGAVLISYRLFGKSGLYAMTAITTLLANLEVLLLVDAFGLEQTLGNVMFAASFLITDILSENESRKEADRAVRIGIFTQAAMLIFTQSWLLFRPGANDWAMPAFRQIFSVTPRLMLASFTGYVLSQCLDVWLYHRLWNFTTRKSGNSLRFLWVRNNAATLISQFINTVVFNLSAFCGWYTPRQLAAIILSSYLIFIFTSLLDTPAVYFARYLKRNGQIPQ